MATIGNQASKLQTTTKISGFAKGLITGSAATVILCGAAAYTLMREEMDRRQKVQRGTEILKYGVPERPPQILYYTNHVLSYDSAKKNPIWVAEHLTKESMEGPANRRRSRFKQDPSLLAEFSSSTEDFWNSGWSRGHLIPAADNKYNQKAMNETFYLTNIVPQDIENNTGFWNRFEIFCRDLATKYADVRIISGPLYRAYKSDVDKKKYVKYEVIGDNNVAVPTHLYKIIVAEDKKINTKYLASFIVPNEPIKSERELREFQVPLETIEKETGIKFFKNLNKSYVNDLCQTNSCKLMNRKQFSQYYLARKLENARSLRTLDRVWKEVEIQDLKQDATLAAKYEEKRQMLLMNSDIADDS